VKPLVDGAGARRSWSDLWRAVDREVRTLHPRVERELREDAVQDGLRSLLAMLDRPFLNAAGGLHFVNCRNQAVSRARRNIAREVKRRARETADERTQTLPAPTTEGPEYLAGNVDLGERIAAWLAADPELMDRFAPLLMRPSALATKCGISRSAASQRQATLRRKLHQLAVEAGHLGGPDGCYDTEPR